MKPLGEADDDLEKFLSIVLKESLITFQADLSSSRISPRDEGRLRSNWFASVGTNDNVDKDATDSPQTDAQQLPLDWRKTYNLVNNLPYAERLAFGNYAVSQDKDWFRAYFNSQGQNVVDTAVRIAGSQI